MATSSDALLAEEERLSEAVYDRLVQPVLRPEDADKYVAIAFEEDAFEIDADDYAATGRLLARRPNARVWLMRAGRHAAYRIRRVAGGTKSRSRERSPVGQPGSP